MAMGYLGCKAVILLLFMSSSYSQAQKKREDRDHWWKLAQTELVAALNVRDNLNVAKNIVLFLGDGMGITTSTAARIYKGQKKGMNGEEGYLSWERFPNMALLKTYNVDKQVPDSAATATAYLCGVKTNYETIAVDSGVPFGNCQMSLDPAHRTPSVLRWAQEAGKHTGIVTTTRITHATPATTYAHVPNRRWECDSSLRQAGTGCKDIASQLISEHPGKDIRVILGGGRQTMGSMIGPKNPFSCVRSDGRNLVKEWLHGKATTGNTAAYVTTSAELNSINVNSIDYLMGLFDESHLPFELDKTPETTAPSLKDMTLKAIQMLKKADKGFFLLVEGGRIDHALHNNNAKKALEETVAFDEAIEAALKELDLEETLVLTTADHSHVITINGFPNRGNDILGLAEVSNIDNLPYTTLMFTNGPGFSFSSNGSSVVRRNPRDMDYTHKEFQQQTAVPMKLFDETHGGEDVAVYAVGPMAHLFHRLHEQHYVAHVMAHAACIGPSKGEDCEQRSRRSTVNAAIQKSTAAQPLVSAATTAGVIPPIGNSVVSDTAAVSILSQGLPTAAGTRTTQIVQQKAATPNFPILSPVLQQLVNEDQDEIVANLGQPQKFNSFSTSEDVRSLLGQHAIPIPHSM